MKKLLLLFAIIPILCSAQIDYPLVKEGGVWRKTYSHMPIMPGDHYYIDYYQYVLQGDTIIDSLSYTKLYSENYDSIHNPIQYVGALRETADHKVWFIKSSDWQIQYSGGNLPSNIDILLYDFGLQVGDIFTTIGSDNQIVGSIDSILVEGLWRKRWNFQSFTQRQWIAGIGDMKGLFFPLLIEFEDYQRLNCYEDSNTFWSHPELAMWGTDCFSVGINSNIQLDNNIKIYPNPVSEILSIESENEFPKNSLITIYDSMGKLLFQSEINFNDKLINLNISKYKSGIYFYRIENSEGLINSGKFLKI